MGWSSLGKTGVLLLKTGLFVASDFGGCSFVDFHRKSRGAGRIGPSLSRSATACMTGKSSWLALSAGHNGVGVPNAVVWSVLFSCRARFLENLAASQKEKISAITRGRAEVLAEAVSGTEQVAPGSVAGCRGSLVCGTACPFLGSILFCLAFSPLSAPFCHREAE